jgi:hypothetical protein
LSNAVPSLNKKTTVSNLLSLWLKEFSKRLSNKCDHRSLMIYQNLYVVTSTYLFLPHEESKFQSVKRIFGQGTCSFYAYTDTYGPLYIRDILTDFKLHVFKEPVPYLHIAKPSTSYRFGIHCELTIFCQLGILYVRAHVTMSFIPSIKFVVH